VFRCRTALSESDVFPACKGISSRARMVILSGSSQWVTLLHFNWEWGMGEINFSDQRKLEFPRLVTGDNSESTRLCLVWWV
ncbi:MAG: hypothetical protein ACRCUG_02090, partial [Yersinia sp. (in: enterobacteria)]